MYCHTTRARGTVAHVLRASVSFRNMCVARRRSYPRLCGDIHPPIPTTGVLRGYSIVVTSTRCMTTVKFWAINQGRCRRADSQRIACKCTCHSGTCVCTHQQLIHGQTHAGDPSCTGLAELHRRVRHEGSLKHSAPRMPSNACEVKISAGRTRHSDACVWHLLQFLCVYMHDA